MKRIFPFLLLIAFCNCQPEATQTWIVTPYPNAVTVAPGGFDFSQGVHLESADPNLEGVVSFFQKRMEEIGVNVDNESRKKIHLELAAGDEKKQEAYALKIGKTRIQLTASHPKGIFYGMMTLWQQLRLSKNMSVPRGFVEDVPRYGHRGFMLDESRHFFGKEKVKQLIDLMAVLKLNTFHWHLTDSPGWRIEIKAYPKLTTVGGIGNHTNPDAPARFYTQEDIKEIVAYAAERQVEIIPEIDMPGHATAANRAYPEFSGGGSEKHPEFTFDPGKEGTYHYLTTILEEVASLFPSEYIHLGGDEVHFGNEKWKTNDSIQALMRREQLSTLVDVEHYFIRRMADQLTQMDKKLAGWDEIVESDVSKQGSVVYWWRHDKGDQLQKSLDKGYATVLCPRVPLYFDFVQHDSHENGRRWDGFGTLEDVYAYPESTHKFTEAEAKLIEGIQGNLWTERFDSDIWVDYMTFPRMVALAESAWTSKDNKNLERFNTNLLPFHNFLESLGIGYFNSFDPTLTPEPEH
ncbi:beta-N-acetylhexosaminidase [Flagellimonas myxillae]|uniref:beta-N-acetylhexosaminidase n=1 Tax=Flagellimonas myxillae TaxID=2942214 RepID=UPI00201F7B53|nr:beta-N-acetylhexosaminidase [Muricauda myxillae]MCL6264881.1 beta-N-acetylhexosaminidase [Muricauda myxillae]